MKWVSVESGTLHIGGSSVDALDGEDGGNQGGLAGVLEKGTVHEFLFDPLAGESQPSLCVASLVARALSPGGVVMWVDAEGTLYPPALQGDIRGLYLIRPKAVDITWAATECLRSRGVGAVVVPIFGRLSVVEARRLQLAAEQGGGVGFLMRPSGGRSATYAAATRWRVSPSPGDRWFQRWRLQLVHGHGRRGGESFTLECRRDVRAHIRTATFKPVSVHSPAALVGRAKVAGAGGW